MWTRLHRGLLIILMCAWLAPLSAGEVEVNTVVAEFINDILHVSTAQRLDFSDEALEALESGIPLTLEFNVEVRRERRYVWDKVLTETTQRYRVERHSISDRYLVTNVATGDRSSFYSILDAVESLEQVDKLPVAERQALPLNEPVLVAVRIRLDKDALPAPIRATAWFSSGWRMKSDWFITGLSS
ncbi:MAG: DUF4390 domain-containing protein [Gammaproteobacteria bacterium]|nr:DUF4390 domain-containing protein [Gammaproteobacteria bacterium]